MTALNKYAALREAANAANIASWGKWEPYKPHKGARGYEVKVGAKAVAQHCLKVDSAFIAAANPATVLALLDELEAAENNLIDSECHVAELEEALRDKQALLEVLDNSLCELLPGTQYMDPPDGGSVTPLEQVRRMVADYRERIEELESRTVTLPKALNSYGGVKIYRPNDVIEAIRAAGIGVKGE